MRDRFYIYTKYRKQIEGLSYEQKGILFDSILAYMSDESIPEMDMFTQFAFNFIKVDLDENTERYEEKCRVNAANGAKGGRPRKTEETEKTERFYEKQTVSEKADASEKSRLMDQIDTIDKIDKDIKEKDVSKDTSKKKRFIKPTVEEVRAYCIERQNGIDAERFIDYYDSNGWKVGKNPMKDWRACVRSWEKNAKENKPQAHPLPDMSKMPKSKPASQNRFNNFEQRQYDFQNLEQAILENQRVRDG